MDTGDDDLSDYGIQTVGPENNEEISLIQDLERELGSVVQRHRVPPDELQQLFEVHAVIQLSCLGLMMHACNILASVTACMSLHKCISVGAYIMLESRLPGILM